MEWTLAHPLQDVEDIVELADSVYGAEIDGILKRDRSVFRKNLTIATTVQVFDKGREFIAVCRGQRDVPFSDQGRLLGYCWFDRGGYTTYSNEEISNAKFHHVDLDLSARQRVRLVNEMIDQHVLWAHTWNVPIICSTSIRGEHDGFMKIHQKRGFQVHGSYAWIRTEKAMEKLNG
jgi:hypothetical protein